MRFPLLAAFVLLPVAGFCVALSHPHIELSAADQRAGYVQAKKPGDQVILIPPVLSTYLTVKQTADNIIGGTLLGMEEFKEGLLRNIFPNAAKTPIVMTPNGSVLPPDPEQILAMKPDAVVFWAHLAAPFKAAGVPLALINIETGQSDAYFEDIWRRVGAVAGASDRTEALIARYREKRKQVLSLVAQQHSRPKGLSLLRTAPMQAYNNKQRSARIMEEVGATNVVATLQGLAIDDEMLVTLNPDIIFVSYFDEPGAIQRLLDNPALRGVNAIRNRRVYRVPSAGDRLQPIAEGALMYDWLAELIHPDAMPKDFRRELRETYREIYGYTLSDQDIDNTLEFDENAGSLGYGRFVRRWSAEDDDERLEQ